jgi:serine/threonine protein phosphatase PrpC
MTRSFHVHSFSEAGGHPVNEDAFEVHRHPADPTGWLCVLADGQGGQPGGAPAARLACRTASAAALRLPPRRLSDSLNWIGILEEADHVVAADPEAGFTTLIGFWLSGAILAGASTGDSALFTVSPSGRGVERTAHQHKNPPVGSGGALPIPFACSSAEGDVILAMTDGVWKYAGRERIIALATASRGADLVEAIQRAARLPGSGAFQDDFTLVVFDSRS